MEKELIVKTIKRIEEFEDVPTEQLHWWIDHSDQLELKESELLFEPGSPADNLHLILSGKIIFYIENNSGRQGEIEIEAPMVTGLLPFSRLKTTRGYGCAVVPTKIMRLHRDQFPELVQKNYELTQGMVQIMTTRVRTFTRQTLQNEKMMALGKMSAGLAHELNNPSAAIARSSKELVEMMRMLPAAIEKWRGIELEEEAKTQFKRLLKDENRQEELTLLQRKRAKQDLEDLLEDNDIPFSEELADELAEINIWAEPLEPIVESLDPQSAAHFLRGLTLLNGSVKMAEDIQMGSKRISELVNSIKRFTHMDRARDKELVDIHVAIRDSLTILQHKIGKKGIKLEGNFEDKGPEIKIFPGDMGQVWTNILDNAADALEDSTGGIITISSEESAEKVFVRIGDNGPGIPEEVLPKIFDPFFTTKAQGKGTGMGLETSMKIIENHNGKIEVESHPGSTIFTIQFSK